MYLRVLPTYPPALTPETPDDAGALALDEAATPTGLERFTHVRALALRPARFDTAWADAAARLPLLETLLVCAKSLEPGALASLARCASLRALDLTVSNRDIPDEALASVGALTQLEALALGGTSAGARTFAALSGLTSLRALGLGGTAVTGAALGKMPAWPALRRLDVSALPLTDKACARIAAQPALEELTIESVRRLSPALFEPLAARGRLAVLEASRTPLSLALLAPLLDRCPLRALVLEACTGLGDEAYERIGALPALETLSLAFARHLSDRALGGIARAPALRELSIVYAGAFSQRALAGLARCATLRAIEAQGVPLADETLLAWVGALALERCGVYGCAGLTSRGVRAARERRPSCAIMADDALEHVGEELPADATVDGRCHDVLVDRDATRLVFDYPGDEQVKDRAGAVLAAKKLVGVENHQDFARHERWLVGTQNSGKTGLWDLATGRFRVFTALPPTVWRAAVTAQAQIAAVEAYGELALVDLGADAVRWTARVAQQGKGIAIGEDGLHVAVGDVDSVRVFDARNGAELARLPDGRAPLALDGTLLYSTRDHAIVRVTLDGVTVLDARATRPGAPRLALDALHRPARLQPAHKRAWRVPEELVTLQWAPREGAAWVALAVARGPYAELRTVDLVVVLQAASPTWPVPVLSGNGRWLCWPSESSDDPHVRVWSVDAVLAFARAHGTPEGALAAP